MWATVIIGFAFSAATIVTFRRDWSEPRPFDSTFKAISRGMLPFRVFLVFGTLVILIQTLDDRHAVSHTFRVIVGGVAAMIGLAGLVLTGTIRLFGWPATLMPPRFRPAARSVQARDREIP
jgi:hypothetical protein